MHSCCKEIGKKYKKLPQQKINAEDGLFALISRLANIVQ